jgi:adenine phosphoribosyltransferase
MHDDAVANGQSVLIVDDLLATGGTARATTDLVTRLGGKVHALAFLIELVALNGRQRLEGHTVHTVLKY